MKTTPFFDREFLFIPLGVGVYWARHVADMRRYRGLYVFGFRVAVWQLS